jgi:molybdopterin converting factor small subunit
MAFFSQNWRWQGFEHRRRKHRGKPATAGAAGLRRIVRMSVKVVLPTAFVRHTDGQKQFTSAAADLPGLLADIDSTFPALGTQIKGEDGKLRRFINIYINDEDIRFLGGDKYSFQDGDEVMLIPSIAGGSPKHG